ncbi:MAG: translation initiation factor IF-2, partial [Oscillospiraceae bacterium]|nr:translation initiation factor IF-2 [Oscillospiraceae bacterium]
MMFKYRVYEVARDLGIKSREISDLLQENFGEIRKHMASLMEEELDFIFEYYTQKNSVEDFTEYFSYQRKEPKPKILKEIKTNKTAEEINSKVSGKGKKSTFINKNDLKATLQKFDFVPKRPPSKTHAITKSPSRKPVTRVIDTRSSDVDIEKYNEKYDRIASEKIRIENTAKKQKITPRFQQRFRPRHSRKETESERLRRIDLERKAKPIVVSIPDEIVVSELAIRLKATVAEVIKKLIELGVMASANETIEFDTASLVAMEFHANVEKEVFVTIEEQIIDSSEDKDDNLVARDPVVVVMGHVDHGKTSLLDAIRNKDVVSTEFGGITQHIGAYRVKTSFGNVTFIDTPGHEAFTTMRARGAKITDIAVLVVAADDGIMPQTIEAINHAKAANVSIITAINKIDKEGADVERVKQQLTEHGLVAEEWGGDLLCAEISARENLNISSLLDMISLTAEMKELKANPQRPAKGTVIEARLDKGRGPMATILIQNGTLKLGDVVIVGSCVGRIRAMLDDKGEKISKAGPSVPVEVVGINGVPSCGDVLDVVSDERLARELVQQRKSRKKEERFDSKVKVTFDNLFDQMDLQDSKEVKVIVKADVKGSAEAVEQSLSGIGDENVSIKVIHSAAGAVNESDVMLASASDAMIVGFNVGPDGIAQKTANLQNINIKIYSVIYDCVDDMKKLIKGMLKPKTKEIVDGCAECRHLYKITNVGVIAGSYVIDGKVKRGSDVRIIRDDVVIVKDKVAS